MLATHPTTTIYTVVEFKHRASEGMFYIGGRGCVLCQFIEKGNVNIQMYSTRHVDIRKIKQNEIHIKIIQNNNNNKYKQYDTIIK